MTEAKALLELHGKRFMSKVQPNLETDCWEWTAHCVANGYGQFSIGTRLYRAHRVAYTMFIGPIPDGLQIDHLCRNRRCVNPAHLEAVTQQENIARGAGRGVLNASKTHCPAGHAYDDANTLLSGGRRYCKACMNARKRAKRADAEAGNA